MGGVVGMGALVGVDITERDSEEVEEGEVETHMEGESVEEREGEVDTEALGDRVVWEVEDSDRVGIQEALPQGVGLSEGVALTVVLVEGVEDGELEALMHPDTVPEKLGVWEEEPDSVALPQALGLEDTLAVVLLDCVPLTVSVEDTVVEVDWEREVVIVSVVVTVAE